MEHIFFKGQVLWSMIDANRHLRHSAYSDFCTQARNNLMVHIGLSVNECAKFGIAPILFREETIFHREIKMDEEIEVAVEMTKHNKLNNRFSIAHTVYKADGTKSATVHVDGAWFDLKTRKLTALPPEVVAIVNKIPKSRSFIEE
ncbi:thioesterase family protein [Flavobacterium sp. CBA20B-1]|uniref:acyl-CoA thioesterase n=1 Tax=unclassified Flavobacterium TaxID=196869 RepID=UPI0022257156|nr:MULTISPECIES: thioesterase family protein [unclassified Flavobacterium]WCM42707.1 thioesterase family protein [Flavobacterium sp. CBA20B-1]